MKRRARRSPLPDCCKECVHLHGVFSPPSHFDHVLGLCRLYEILCVSPPSNRSSAGGSCLSSLCGKATVAASTLLRSVSPQQLGEGDVLDEDVAREVERVGQGGGDGDAVKVIDDSVP